MSFTVTGLSGIIYVKMISILYYEYMKGGSVIWNRRMLGIL